MNPCLVFGASGRVGTAFVDAAIKESVPLKLFVRRPETLSSHVKSSPLIKVISGDIRNQEQLNGAMKGADKVLLIVPDDPRQVELEQAVYKAALPHNVHIVKISALLAGTDPPRSFGVLHRQGEQELEASGLPYTILRPAMFMQSLELFAEPLHQAGFIIIPSGTGKVSFVDIDVVAECSLRIILDDSTKHFGKVYTLTGSKAWSMAEVAKLLSARMGKTIAHWSPPAWLAYWIYRLLAGMNAWMAERVTDLFVAIAEGAESECRDDVQRINNIRQAAASTRTLEDYLERQTVFQQRKVRDY